MPVTVIEPSFRTLLMPAIRTAPLMESGLVAAIEAAIALSAITMRTEKERRLALATLTNP